jgi:hypothetical protein
MGSDFLKASSSPLIQFYSGGGRNSSGRLLSDIRAWNHDRLEHTHDYIQWLFPTRQPSQFNPSAPILDEEEIRHFLGSHQLQTELIASAKQMLDFYGLGLRDVEGEPIVERTAEWNRRLRIWLTPGNHNFLRITRILTSLRLLGLAPLAVALLAALESIYEEHSAVIGERTIQFWRAAGR